MGLDMFLYATGKNHRRVQELAKARADEYRDFCCSLIEEDRYVGLKGINRRTLTDKRGVDKEERHLLAAFKRELLAKGHSLEGIVRRDLSYAYIVKKDEEDPIREIGYWRKEWLLHEFIIKSFGDPDNDNLCEVYLDEVALNKLAKKYPVEDAFKDAIAIVKGGGVVYYYAWY